LAPITWRASLARCTVQRALQKAKTKFSLSLSRTAWFQTLNSTFNQNPRGQPAAHQLKEKTMKNTLLDILAALVVAAALTVGALAYFDVLTK
jgi:hypothetical protein